MYITNIPPKARKAIAELERTNNVIILLELVGDIVLATIFSASDIDTATTCGVANRGDSWASCLDALSDSVMRFVKTLK